MNATHPLRTLALAISTNLNHPEDLLEEIAAVPSIDEGRYVELATMARRAALCLAEAAILFKEPKDPLKAVADPRFTGKVQDAATSLATLVRMSWPTMVSDKDAQLRAACIDVALGCLVLAGGHVPRRDVGNFLTNLIKAIPYRPEGVHWSFVHLPQFDEEWRKADPAKEAAGFKP